MIICCLTVISLRSKSLCLLFLLQDNLLPFFRDFNQQTVLLFQALNFQEDTKVVMMHSSLSNNCRYCNNKVGALFSRKLCPGLFFTVFHLFLENWV